MKKRLALVLVLVLLASAASTALASPFADVPADHWAYDSVAELAAAGLIEGYPDGTYGGARMMTRYEAAMVFARALGRLESQIANNNLLPELDKIKAELMAEIEAQMAAAGKPVVETRVVETVQKELDEEAAARIRANEIATEALEGDMAYLEARMLGLIDGIRHDMSQLEEQEVVVVEQPSMDEIEALIAARVQEALLGVASGVKETTIVEKVVSTTPELTRTDVELIAEALIRKQVQEVDRQVQENRDLIVGLVDWVDELDGDVAVLKDDVAGLKTSVAKFENAPILSGELSLEGEYESDGNYAFTQEGTLNLNLKPSEATSLKAFFEWELEPFNGEYSIENYGVEVTSETPLSRLLVGRIHSSNLAPFSNYVLPNGHQGFGGVAKVNIIDDLTLDVLAAQTKKADDEADPAVPDTVLAAVALTYEFMPELGIKLTGRTNKPAGEMFDNYAAGVGLFGTVAGIKYTGDFAMDLRDEDVEKDNFIAVVTAETKFDPVTIDLKGIYEASEYAISQQLLLGDTIFGVEGGAKAALDLGGFDINLGGRAYYEGGAPEEAENDDTILAFKADASTTFNVGLPVTLSAQYVGNKTGDDAAEFKNHVLAKLAVEQDADFGLRYGANAAYEKNVLYNSPTAAPNWKNIKHMTDREEFRAGANLGYGLDWSGATVDLDYAATFTLPLDKDPITEEADDMTLGHEVTVGYGFTKDVKLTLGATVDMTFAEELQNAFGYNAGLTVKF